MTHCAGSLKKTLKIPFEQSRRVFLTDGPVQGWQEGGGGMKRLVCGLACVGAVALLGLSGCSNHYSEQIKYGARTDPIFRSKELTAKPTWPEPDRPGQLPIQSIKDLQDERNPLYTPEDPTGRKLFAENKLIDPMAIPAEQRGMLAFALEGLFGTPAQPKVQLDESIVTALKVDMPVLKEGSRLYRIHCVHCHGVSGDGRGPTGRWINPHPRDFRQGIFKFQSVSQAGKSNRPPHREDLYRIIQNGVEGTAMPSFLLLKREEIDAMVSYVIHLSIRGRAEFDTINTFVIKDGTLYHEKTPKNEDGSYATLIKDQGAKAALQESILADIQVYAQAAGENWAASQKTDALINAKENPYAGSEAEKFKSMLRGKLLFNGQGGTEKRTQGGQEISVTVEKEKAKQANCVECHVDYGRRAEFRWDDWGTQVKPRNFTEGFFRGGRRPLDIYHRIHSGINGAGMQAYFGLGEETIWDLTNFVQALGYPAMRAKLGID